MHQPRPHGTFGPTDLPAEDAAFAERLMRTVTNLKQVGGIDSLRMTRALPGGGAVTALDMGGIVKVIVHKPQSTQSEDEDTGELTTDVPMLFSGIVERTRLKAGEKAVVLLTKQTQKRLGGYDTKAKKRPEEQYSTAERQELERFSVRYGPRFSEFEPKPGAVTHTQYAQLRATWYSGAMAKVVQIVSGYGKTKFDTKPRNPTELAKMIIPSAVRAQIAKELASVATPGYSGKPPSSGQIQYDYKFYESHAVAFGQDNKPWLLQINRQGVHAMPLPLIPATTTKAFKEYVKKVGDTELKWILDEFGGMPSGEPFPKGKQFQAWKRAGVILKVCDTSDYFDHSMYSSACGWSFNSKGTEGYATCYNYDEGKGVAYGLTYTMRLSIGKLKPTDEARKGWKELGDAERPQLMRYLGDVLMAAKSKSDEVQALRYKLRNTPASELLTRAKTATNPQAEAEFWINKESDPIATASGSVAQTEKGWLHSKLPSMYQPQIKFPEPLFGVCLSFNFAPLMHGRQENPKCDTTMFTYYDGDTLKTVKYFKDPSKSKKLPQDGFTDCMTVGSWEKKEFLGDAGLQGNFYTTDADDRRMTAEQERVTTIVGKDLGYDSQPHFAFDNFFSMPGSLWRHRYFSHDTTTHTATGKSLGIGLCVPYLCRDALLYATKDVTLSATTSKALTLGSVTDPYSYRFWTYDFVHAWHDRLPVMNGKPWPKDGSPVWVEMEEYAPGPCSDFADNGPWIKGLPTDYTWLIHPNKNEWRHSGGGGPPSFKGSSSSTEAENVDKRTLSFSFGDLRKILDDADSGYFLASPTDNGFYFSRGATRICAGESVYQNVSEKVNGKNAYSGYTRLADHQSAHCFIGVINE